MTIPNGVLLGNTPTFVGYFDGFPAFSVGNLSEDTVTCGFADPKVCVMQTNAWVVERCMQMVTDPEDLVVDPACGGGTTAAVAEQRGGC